MATVQFLDRTYTLPEIANEQFRRLQEQVRARQRLIQVCYRANARTHGLQSDLRSGFSLRQRDDIQPLVY